MDALMAAVLRRMTGLDTLDVDAKPFHGLPAVLYHLSYLVKLDIGPFVKQVVRKSMLVRNDAGHAVGEDRLDAEFARLFSIGPPVASMPP
jgi:hypothetical protein